MKSLVSFVVIFAFSFICFYYLSQLLFPRKNHSEIIGDFILTNEEEEEEEIEYDEENEEDYSYSNFNERQIVKEPVRGERNIIFLETGCVLESNKSEIPGLALSKRQACAVESAARQNPDATVYLLYTCPINGNLIVSHQYVKELFEYSNVKIWRIDLSKHLARTPLGTWNFKEHLKISKFPAEHASDILRYVSLWKYGGTYIDLDVFVLRSFYELGTNFVGKQDYFTLGTNVLDLNSGDVGHELAGQCLTEIINNFRGYLREYNGPALVTRVLNKLCETTSIKDMTPDKCSGLKVLPENHFTPIDSNSWRRLFNQTEAFMIRTQLFQSFALHTWNKMTKSMQINLQDESPYVVLARQFCPRVVTNSWNVF